MSRSICAIFYFPKQKNLFSKAEILSVCASVIFGYFLLQQANAMQEYFVYCKERLRHFLLFQTEKSVFQG